MSVGFIMVVSGIFGSITSLIYFFYIKKKSPDEIMQRYISSTSITVIGNTVKANNTIKDNKNPSEEIKVPISETEFAKKSSVAETQQRIDVTLEETYLIEDNIIKETEISNDN